MHTEADEQIVAANRCMQMHTAAYNFIRMYTAYGCVLDAHGCILMQVEAYGCIWCICMNAILNQYGNVGDAFKCTDMHMEAHASIKQML